MQVSVQIQNDGHAVIPVEVIARLGGQPGSKLVIEMDTDHAMLRVANKAVGPSTIYARDIPPHKSVQDFLNEYEIKYRMSSEDFWRKFQAGEMACDVEFIDWAGFYEHKRSLEKLGIDPKTATFQRFVPEGQN